MNEFLRAIGMSEFRKTHRDTTRSMYNRIVYTANVYLRLIVTASYKYLKVYAIIDASFVGDYRFVTAQEGNKLFSCDYL